MIKLNNKNITYVALADSNNSLKAPKEIWYADSANSVKLVYRRKDALIEGEDYEKYHWLVGEIPIGASMLSLPINSSTFSYQTVLGKQQANINHFTTNGYTYFTNNNSMDIVNIYDNVNKKTVSSSSVNSRSMDIESSENGMTVNGVNIQQLGFPVKNKLITSVPNSPNATTTKTSKITVDGTKRYIPCKLLKPVPKWLDANGIRRQVGECGMIDLVSGKFYGNVNSVGTFTVENYYERKEWLVGDGSAYINTTHNTNEVLDYETSVSNLTFGKCLFWFRIGGYGENKSVMIAATDNSTYKGLRVANVSSEVRLSNFESDNTVVSTDSNSIYINGIQYSCIRSDDVSMAIRLFYSQFTDAATSDSVKCAYFRLLSNGSIIQNLIPCTLTMDLPASMDANNIARTKGTSGMWDLVSDRFFGNVASSGTFKAVNLAEGEDYEVHQWLGSASGTPYLKVQDGVNTDENAYVETTYKCNYSNGGTDIMIGVSINESNNIGIRIFNSAYNGGTTYVDYHKTVNGVLSSFRTVKKQDNINAERYIKATFDKLIIDNSEYQISFGNGFDNIKDYSTRLHCNANNNAVRYKRTKIRVNNVEYDLIPVKLLRSIPAKYDANGIARQAGECGMYDTVNDLFYGNVASSGTFSVSDDS